MTRILAIADEVDEALYEDKLTRLRPDLVVSCGDLPFDYLEYIVSRSNVPLVYVLGNHDPELRARVPEWTQVRVDSPIPGPQGCDNADGRVISAAHMRIAGLGGSMRYKPGPHQYTDAEMRWRALRLEARIKLNPSRAARKIDILVTHAPPLGWDAKDDLAHRGFASFVRLVHVVKPKLLIHGHVHPYGRSEAQRALGSTQVINAVPSKLIDI